MRHAFVIAIAIVLALASYGCGDGGPPRSAVPGPSATPTSQTALGETPGLPDLTVSAGGESVTAGVGTYCWSGQGRGLCVDKVGVPTPPKALVATVGTSLTARLSKGTPREVSAHASPLAADATPTSEGRDDVFWESLGEGEELPLETLGRELSLTTTNLAPGRYVVAISVFFERGGDAQYGVLLELGPEG